MLSFKSSTPNTFEYHPWNHHVFLLAKLLLYLITKGIIIYFHCFLCYTSMGWELSTVNISSKDSHQGEDSTFLVNYLHINHLSEWCELNGWKIKGLTVKAVHGCLKIWNLWRKFAYCKVKFFDNLQYTLFWCWLSFQSLDPSIQTVELVKQWQRWARWELSWYQWYGMSCCGCSEHEWLPST